MRNRIVAALVAVAAAALPAGARAESIAYIDGGGHIAIAAPDGSDARAVTSTTGWKWPSQSDGGTIAALHVGTGAVVLMDQFGTITGGVQTPGYVSGGFDVTLYPRISPDGSKVAYGNLDPSDGASVYWSPTNTTSFSHPNQTLGQEDTTAPSWIDSTKMLLTHYGETLTDTQKQLYFYSAGNADNTETDWASDPFTPSATTGSWEATGFAAAINRQQTAIAFAMDDEADWGGTTHNSVIDVFPTTGTPGQLDTTRGCRLTLMPNGNDGIGDAGEISPSFSPDGTQFAFATDAGVWVASLPTDWSDCSNLSASLVIAGGSYPYWSPANVQAPPPTPPAGGSGGSGGSGSGGSAGTGSGGGANPPAPQPAPITITSVGHPIAAFTFPRRLRARRKATFSAAKSTDKGARIVRYTWSFGDRSKPISGISVRHAFRRPGRYTVTLKIVDSTGRSSTMRRHVKVGR